MSSNECATIRRLFQRFRTSVGPLILIFIGLTILHLLFRKYVTDVGTFWCDTDLAAVVIIIGIIDLFEGLLDEIRRLNEKLTEKEKIIQSQNAIVNKLTQEFKLSKEQIKEKLRFHYRQSPIPAAAATVSSYADNELLEELRQLRNQILKRDEIIQQKGKALHEVTMERNLLEENLKASDVEQLRQEILIKEKENVQQKELKQLSKEAQKLRKEISAKDVIICESNEKCKKLEEIISKMNTVSYQNETIPRKPPSNPSTPKRQILVHSNDIFKTSQQQKKEEKGLELLQTKKLPLSNITNTMTSLSRERLIPLPPHRNSVEADDDLPPPPSILLYHTSSSSSAFATSSPALHQIPHVSSSSELSVKRTPPPIAPKPKPATSPPPAPQPPPPSLVFNKSVPATPSSSNISTPTKPPKSQQRTLNSNILAEIQSSPKLKNLKEAEEERKKKEVEKSKSIKNNKFNFTADLKTQLSQRADKVNSTITDDEKENDDSDDEWEK